MVIVFSPLSLNGTARTGALEVGLGSLPAMPAGRSSGENTIF